MATFRELLAATKAEIRETDPAGAEQAAAEGATILDIREPDETAQGIVPESIQIVRGNLESQVESRITDKDAPIVVMCAGGVRSAMVKRRGHSLQHVVASGPNEPGDAAHQSKLSRWRTA